MKNPVFTLSHRKTLVTKFDLDVNYVMVTPVSSFEQIKMGWGPPCYIRSFVEISLRILEKTIFEGFLPYHGVQCRMISVDIFFGVLRLFCFVVAICDLVHAVEAMSSLP